MPEINKRWEEETKGDSDWSRKITFINECAKEMLTAESEEVKRAVQLFQQAGESSGGSGESSEIKEVREKQE